MLLLNSFAILGTLVIAMVQCSVGFVMHVAGAGALIMLPLVLLRYLLVLARRILRSQNIPSAINSFALIVPHTIILSCFFYCRHSVVVLADWMLFEPILF